MTFLTVSSSDGSRLASSGKDQPILTLWDATLPEPK
jgi:hypothetical protein